MQLLPMGVCTLLHVELMEKAKFNMNYKKKKMKHLASDLMGQQLALAVCYIRVLYTERLTWRI